MTEFQTIVAACATQAEQTARALAMAGRFEPLYLHHLPSKPGMSGQLRMVPDSEPCPPGWTLTHGEGLRGNVPYSAFWQWIADRARSAPILNPTS